MKNNILLRLLRYRWNIGFVIDSSDLLSKQTLNVRWLKHSYKKGWFADPFILRITDDEIILLVEEFYDPIDRGRISKLIIDKQTLSLKIVKPILELNSHLSFPVIYREGDSIYIYPENSISETLVLYKYDESDDSISYVKVLSEEPLTDAVLVFDYDKPIILSTKIPTQNSNELNIYESVSSNIEEWNFHKVQTVVFNDNTARNAGLPFKNNGKIIRPAQDCNNAYGRGLVLQEMQKKEGVFSFVELKRFYPISKKWNKGMHTMNMYEDLIVVDGCRYRYPLIATFLLMINRFYKAL